MEMGHVIAAALCGDAIFADWATRANILCIATVEELSKFLNTEPVDWIFSVANPLILPPDVFGRAQRGAYNYHDGPLPRYAGTHATSWALLARETEHGVAWHRIDDGVDTGDVVVQRQVLIDPTDTALTLNLKCYEAAIEGFRELLAGLKNGKLTAHPQALENRSYFPKRRRPDAAGCLRWDQSAQELAAMTRALDFGPFHPNPLCLPKVLVGDEVVTVRRLEVLPRRSGVSAGSLLEVHSSHWRLATGTEDVDVCFGGPDGQVLDARALAKHCNLDEGSRLPILRDEQARSITAAHELLAPSEDFWRRRLERFKTLQLPFLSSPVAEAPPRWQSSSGGIPSALAKLSPLDRTEYLVTAWLTYLARITGETELQLGWTPVSDGSQAGSKAVEVLIASVVPMEITIDLEQDFEEMRKVVAAEFAQLRAHASFARDLIARCPTLRGVEALRLHRPWPIGITITTDSCSVAGDLKTSPRAGPALCGDLLTFEICALDGSFRWHFDASRLAPKQTDRMTQHLQALLHGVMADAGQPVGRIELLPAAERTYLLEDLNRTAAAYPSQRCIHELFEAQVRQAPEAVAVVHEDERLSYGELNARANRLAHHLIALGVRPDQPVAICLERSLAMVVGVLAILKAGGAYLPLDPAYPSARLRQVVEDAAPRLLLADAAGRAALGPEALVDLSVVDLETATPAWAELSASDPEPRALGLTARHLAYVIYTSGSTGTPKGVMVEHRGVVNHTSWQADRFQLAAYDIFLQRTSLSFDAAVWELWTALLIGARVILLPLDRQFDVRSIVDLLNRHRVTVLQLVPSLLSALLELRDVEQNAIGSLRYIFCGGELLRNEIVAKWLQLASRALVNLYGPTEATIDTTAWEHPVGFSGTVVPIGRPIANTRVYLLDGHGAPVPFGAVGELYIGGAGVARGYLNRPDLTAERFIASPFVEGDRLYKTGDLARYLPDGNLEFLGRNDDQVKIRGFRIEPGEIAARLCEHAWVREAVVVARQDRAGDKHLVAYVVCAPEAGSDDEDGGGLAGALRAHVSGRLPDYMVPAAFVRLAALPLMPNGKLDRKALPAPAEGAYARTAYEAPRGAVETALAEIWAELLGVERVGRHDNFFELGGHSLLAVQLLSRVSDLGLKFSAADLFHAPVLKELASRVEIDFHRHRPGILPIRATGSQPPLFFVPDGWGDCSYVISLVKEMNIDCPVYALPWPPFNDLGPPTLEAIAAEVIIAIREIQPQGPYRFAGYSSGAILAYALAKHLLIRGEIVPFMAFIDVTLPATSSSMSDAQVVAEMIFEYRGSLDDDKSEMLEKCARKSSSVLKLLEMAQQIGAIVPQRDFYDDALRCAYFHRALQSYRVPFLPIEIHQFYAADPFLSRRMRLGESSIGPEARSLMRGWDRILSVAAIHAVPVPGNHDTMMSYPENRRILARRLSRALNSSPTTHAEEG
ncbi:amino acid adenylation domain-containing protein [Mesorhizobium sp.]|uniref:amino acid adenylation domain-containing protein n=1 Tax=Mesorhizobium sp. TaxID=1871066 RepID=UPI00257DCD9D|nr:amino acid adenylation domain-containing protein [Mesorhizobium sp.]